MPSGKIHNTLTKTFIPVAGVLSVGGYAIAYQRTDDPFSSLLFSFFVMLGYLLGFYLTPDLDLLGITNNEYKMMRELKFIGVLITMWFLPYAYAMRFVGIGRKGHRNFFSHFPGVGTAIRLVWLLIPAVSVSLYFDLDILTPLSFLAVWAVLIGLSLSDSIHYFADVFMKGKE